MLKVIKNVKIYLDGEWKNKEILFSQKIEKIADKIDIDEGLAEIFDFDGNYCIPGLIDSHVHITGGGGEGSFITQVPPMRLITPVKAGVTTMVGLLGTDGETRSVKNLVAKTKAFNEFGLTCFCLTGNYNYPSPTLTGSVETDITFVDEIIGVKIAICDHRSANMSDEDLIKLASDARVAGLLSGKAGIVHLHTGSGKEGLGQIFRVLDKTDIPVTVFRPTHVSNKYDDALKLANMGGFVDFTTGENNLLKRCEIFKKALNEFPEGHFSISTDSNGSLPRWNEKKEMIGIGAGKISALHQTIKCLVNDLGVKLEDAIKPCTINAAKSLNIFPRKGILQDGSDADILILDKDLNVDTLFANGKLMMLNKKIMVNENFKEMYEE